MDRLLTSEDDPAGGQELPVRNGLVAVAEHLGDSQQYGLSGIRAGELILDRTTDQG